MGIADFLLLGVGLAMDAFAVSICKGLTMTRDYLKKALIIGAYFGGFQVLMPLAGYFLGSRFQDKITAFDHWIAFGLLVFIGVRMLKEAFDKGDDKNANDRVDFVTMLVLAIATSIDALAVGITFAFLQVRLVLGVTIIGVVTFWISFAGVKVGNKFGDRFRNQAEFIGGIILIGIGAKILLEHLGVLP